MTDKTNTQGLERSIDIKTNKPITEKFHTDNKTVTEGLEGSNNDVKQDIEQMIGEMAEGVLKETEEDISEEGKALKELLASVGAKPIPGMSLAQMAITYAQAIANNNGLIANLEEVLSSKLDSQKAFDMLQANYVVMAKGQFSNFQQKTAQLQSENTRLESELKLAKEVISGSD